MGGLVEWYWKNEGELHQNEIRPYRVTEVFGGCGAYGSNVEVQSGLRGGWKKSPQGE